MPWIGFSFLALIDWVNIRLSEDKSWLEDLAGGIMFFGPFCISYCILHKGYKIYSTNQSPSRFFAEKLVTEYKASKIEALLMLTGAILLVILIATQYIGPWGKTYELELTLVILTILLDCVAIFSLITEIKEFPQKFEKKPWILWLISVSIALLINIATQNEWNSIGSILIGESIFIFLLVSLCIWYFSKKHQI